jgi:hypothetical protein
MGRARGLSKADQQLWAAFSQDILLLPGRARLPVEPAPPPPVAPAVAEPVPRVKVVAQARPVQIGTAPAGLDKSSWTKFRDGRQRAGRTLDLHGLTATRIMR